MCHCLFLSINDDTKPKIGKRPAFGWPGQPPTEPSQSHVPRIYWLLDSFWRRSAALLFCFVFWPLLCCRWRTGVPYDQSLQLRRCGTAQSDHVVMQNASNSVSTHQTPLDCWNLFFSGPGYDLRLKRLASYEMWSHSKTKIFFCMS